MEFGVSHPEFDEVFLQSGCHTALQLVAKVNFLVVLPLFLLMFSLIIVCHHFIKTAISDWVGEEKIVLLTSHSQWKLLHLG